MKIEKYVVILVSQNGDKTHLRMSVNRGDKTAEIRLAEACQTDNAALYVLGVTSIREFALPLMVGIICGAYSSVCITGALWYLMKTKLNKNKK